MAVQPIIQFEGITKRFPGIVALDGVSLQVDPGSCHGLVGENGAGKSTLGKILAGIYTSDSGRLLVEGKPVRFTNPLEAMNAGIGVVHQELSFCENLSVAENLCLHHLPSRGPFLAARKLHEQAKKLLAEIGVSLDVTKRLGDYSISQQQLVQIAAAIGRGAKIILFDEPTSSLSEHEAARLFDLIRNLQARGVTMLYVSHRMKELFSLCDTLSVLRDGRLVTTKPTSEFNENTLVEAMIGRQIESYFPDHLHSKPGAELLRVERYSSPGKFRDISFSLHAGEVLGFAGLVGAGRTEVAEALFGLDPNASGQVWVQGKPAHIKTPSDAISRGLGLVPEDRKRHGLVLGMSARKNMTLPTQAFDYMKTKIESLEALYPKVTFIWWTIPLETTNWDEGRKDQYNNLVRDYCRLNNKILFDLADIECHNAQGDYIKDQFGYSALDPSYATDSGHLNVPGQDRVANAMWWLLARLTGWAPTQTHSSPEGYLKAGKWNLVSIPIDLENSDPISVFNGVDLADSSLQFWQNDTPSGGFRAYGSWTGPIARGSSYWLLERNGTVDRKIQVAGNAAATNFEITIPAHASAPFWIMFGTPFTTDVPVDNVRFQNTAVSAESKSWAEASSLNMVASKAMGFDGSTQRFFSVGGIDTAPDRKILQPWYGYWLLVNRPEELKIIFTAPTQ